MIKLENYEVIGWEHAIRGMRNPKNSWDRSDSGYGCNLYGNRIHCRNCNVVEKGSCMTYRNFEMGENDHELIMKLAKGGSVHAKYRRMVAVYVDITAPLYWWKEFDTYKVGTVANSCSTMHKIHEKEFTLEDFSCEHLINSVIDEKIAKEYELDMFEKYKLEGHQLAYNDTCGYLAIQTEASENQLVVDYYSPKNVLEMFIISALNANREAYLKTKDKKYWWQMIQLLPSSYNQKRTVMLNYEVLANIYTWRKDHKLDEWKSMCEWIEQLPYSEIITGGIEE